MIVIDLRDTTRHEEGGSKKNTKMIYARSGERVIALKGDIDKAKGGHKFKTLIECYK